MKSELIGRRVQVTLGLAKLTDAMVEARRDNHVWQIERFFGRAGKIIAATEKGDEVTVSFPDGRTVTTEMGYLTFVQDSD